MILFPIISLIICLVIRFIQAKSVDKETGEVFSEIKISPVYLIVGYVSFFFCATFSVFAYFFMDAIDISVLFLIFSVMLAAFIFGFYRYRVIYDREKLSCRKYFGKYKTMYYSEIVHIEYGLDLIIRTGKDTLIISGDKKNVSALYAFLQENLKLDEKNELPPRVRKLKDALYRPGEFYFIFGIAIVISVLMSAILIWEWIQGRVEGAERVYVVLMLILSLILAPGYVIISVVSAKRAHSSEKWRKIAYMCIREEAFRK